jgi:glycosyltransferase involved in cell wall biosynthesis
MIKVTALTGSKHDASSRFRIRQFIRPLGELGIRVSEYWPLISRYKLEAVQPVAMAMRVPGLIASRFSDLTWLGRELISGRFSFEHLTSRKRIFDVDDAIWLPYASDFSAKIVEHCDGVIAGNRFLADHYEKLGARVWLVPTSVDTDRWKPKDRPAHERWTIGWSGSWSNLQFLYRIEETLADFLSEHPDGRLLVVCDRRPSFKRLSPDRWEFVKWTMENEVSQVQAMDVGLMPLADSEMAHGKCGFKMLSYMAVGLPVIVSPIGVNKEILDRGKVGLTAGSGDEWFRRLKQLYSDRSSGKAMGSAGRKVVEEHYSVRANVGKLAAIFRQVIAG